MLAYERGAACRMAYLQHALDDDSQPTGRCDNLRRPWYPTEIPDPGNQGRPRAVGPSRHRDRAARDVADRDGPARGLVQARSRRRSRRRTGECSLACRTWDGANACARLQRDGPVPQRCCPGWFQVLTEWGWAQRPVAVVAIPSRARPALVTSFARGIAEIGRLRYLGTLDVIDGGPAGEPGGNSAFRLANVGAPGRRSGIAEAWPGIPGPILLVVDDCDRVPVDGHRGGASRSGAPGPQPCSPWRWRSAADRRPCTGRAPPRSRAGPDPVMTIREPKASLAASRVVDGVPGTLGSLLDVGLGLLGQPLGLQTLVVRGVTDLLLDLADGLFGGIADLVADTLAFLLCSVDQWFHGAKGSASRAGLRDLQRRTVADSAAGAGSRTVNIGRRPAPRGPMRTAYSTVPSRRHRRAASRRRDRHLDRGADQAQRKPRCAGAGPSSSRRAALGPYWLPM